MNARVVHKREVEGGEFGSVLSWYPLCDRGTKGEPRYRQNVHSAREWPNVTCKLCLRYRPKVRSPEGDRP